MSGGRTLFADLVPVISSVEKPNPFETQIACVFPGRELGILYDCFDCGIVISTLADNIRIDNYNGDGVIVKSHHPDLAVPRKAIPLHMRPSLGLPYVAASEPSRIHAIVRSALTRTQFAVRKGGIDLYREMARTMAKLAQGELHDYIHSFWNDADGTDPNHENPGLPPSFELILRWFKPTSAKPNPIDRAEGSPDEDIAMLARYTTRVIERVAENGCLQDERSSRKMTGHERLEEMEKVESFLAARTEDLGIGESEIRTAMDDLAARQRKAG